ncbi:MAG TPA: hypothetical protein VFX03_13090, partial [Thermomicrobiales bacterium]|nr:hypothetical protein [Thermomicrobiales bacterium]
MTWLRAATWLILIFASTATALPAAAQSAPGGGSPALAAQAIRSALFDAQAALLAGDAAAAHDAVEAAQDAAGPLASRFTADAGVAPEIAAALDDAAVAASDGDATAMGVASGRVWAALTRGGYAETLAAVGHNDAADAAQWLLLRDFRPTTTLSRPGADATLAVRKLGAGDLTPEQTAAAVRGDLLDTYQAQLEAELDDIAGAAPDKLSPTQAAAVGLAAGHWPVLAGAYETQQGADARTKADAAFAALPAAVANGDTA